MFKIFRYIFFGLLLFYCNSIKSQELYQGSFAIDDIESNALYQTFDLDNSQIISGLYFDNSIDRWTGFIGEIDQNGAGELICTEINDTIIGLNICNRMIADSTGLYILGVSSQSFKVLHYNFNFDSCTTIKIYNGIEENSSITGLDFDYSGQLLFSGFERNNSDSKDIKVFIYDNSVLNSYSENIICSRLTVSKTVQDKDENIYIAIANNSNNEDEMKTYIVSLDKDLNFRFSTRDTQKEINFTIGKGIHIDSGKNILLSGYTVSDNEIFIPKIIKLDCLGNLLWVTVAGNNSINNDEGWGAWNEIISSHDNQHYLVVGAENYKNAVGDTTIVSALVSKLTHEGNIVWSNRYSFRESQNQTICVLNDIVKSGTNSYYLSGNSIDFSGTIDEIPDPPNFRSIYMKMNEEGMTGDDTTSILNVSSGQNIIEIYPNPTADLIKITNKQNIDLRMNVSDLLGNVLISKEINKNIEYIFSFSQHQIKPGVYMLSFFNKNRLIKTNRIILK